MIQYNELQITPDGKYLIIDASVENFEYFADMTISEITIDNQDTYLDSGPSSNPIYNCKISEIESSSTMLLTSELSMIKNGESYYYVDKTKKRIRFILSSKDLGIDLNTNLLFVYIIVEGTPASDTPCGFDNKITIAPIYNKYPIYKNSIYLLSEFNNQCKIPQKLIDAILHYKALTLCLSINNNVTAIDYWKKFYGNTISNISNYKCPCYERDN